VSGTEPLLDELLLDALPLDTLLLELDVSEGSGSTLVPVDQKTIRSQLVIKTTPTANEAHTHGVLLDIIDLLITSHLPRCIRSSSRNRAVLPKLKTTFKFKIA
jgi:hypothetical protein